MGEMKLIMVGSRGELITVGSRSEIKLITDRLAEIKVIVVRVQG